jgi:hypothetical protein
MRTPVGRDKPNAQVKAYKKSRQLKADIKKMSRQRYRITAQSRQFKRIFGW